VPDDALPRLVPGRPFPPYSYVPGLFPHPVSDPGGHSFGVRHQPPGPLDADHWDVNEDYLHGIDLFNHGYYWEAHEVWEGLWHAAGREGVVADFLKGLIQLTAAGVKVRQQVPRGVAGLGQGSADLFRRVREDLDPDVSRFLGLNVERLHTFALELAEQPERDPGPADAPAARVLSLVLRPRRGTA
jgi:hypothetical protein